MRVHKDERRKNERHNPRRLRTLTDRLQKISLKAGKADDRLPQMKDYRRQGSVTEGNATHQTLTRA